MVRMATPAFGARRQCAAVFPLHAAGSRHRAQPVFAAARSEAIRRFPRRFHYPLRPVLRMDRTVEPAHQPVGFAHRSGLAHLQRYDRRGRLFGAHARQESGPARLVARGFGLAGPDARARRAQVRGRSRHSWLPRHLRVRLERMGARGAQCSAAPSAAGREDPAVGHPDRVFHVARR